MGNRLPQRPRRPPVRRQGQPEEDYAERWSLVDDVLLPAMESIATDLSADPSLSATAFRGKSNVPGAVLEVLKQGRDGRQYLQFRCIAMLIQQPVAIVTFAEVWPTFENGLPSSTGRKIQPMTFGAKGLHLSDGVSVADVKARIQAEYDKTVEEARPFGF